MEASGATPAPTVSRVWTMEHQRAFARATGDVNPMHLDEQYARRTLAGGAAVHGVHAALWALDACSATRSFADLSTLQMRFERFVLVGDRSVIAVHEGGDDDLRLSLSVAGIRALTILATFAGERPVAAPIASTAADIPDRPAVVETATLTGLAGAFRISDGAATAALVPRLSRAIGPARVAAIGALSTLVGMVVPGLHSILSKIDVTFTEDCDGTNLIYTVKRFHPVLQSITTQVSGPGITARVESFVRPRPIEQESLLALKGMVRPDEFAQVRALVIGGSRGLGATTAKLLAAGGGEVCITYVSGSAESDAIAGEIGDNGGRCQVLRFDAGDPVEEQLSPLWSAPSQLYHFATPRIFRQKRAPFERDICAEMMQIYNYSFVELCHFCLKRSERLAAFYPSTVAIDENSKDILEYIAAKSAGEALARALSGTIPNLNVAIERLPRASTDQTATMFPVPAAPPETILLPIIRKMVALC